MMEQKLTLYQLNSLIKKSLSNSMPKTVWVVGEISELKVNRNGHCYLELIEKDDNQIIARGRATVWSYTYRMLKPYFESTTGQYLTQGIKVMVLVSVEYHVVYGLSLNIKDIDPTYTIGDMALQRKKIIARLKKEGVYEMNKELQLPIVPQKIAIISSSTAAGYQDFIHQLETNSFGIKFYTHLFEATMQGKDTVPTVISALEKIFKYDDFFDAVAIIRGGGATADLGSFDNYELAYNIAQFPIPVITGIGHEKDDTVIDMVAHTRLKTPTAVAEFFINGAEVFIDRLLTLQNDLVEGVTQTIDYKQKQLEDIAGKLSNKVNAFIDDKGKNLVKLSNYMQQQQAKFVFNKKYRLINLGNALQSAMTVWKIDAKRKFKDDEEKFKSIIKKHIEQNIEYVELLREKLVKESKKIIDKNSQRVLLNENNIRLLNPDNILKRGYTLTMLNGKIIKSTDELQVHDEIDIKFSDGFVKSKVLKK